MLVQSDCIMVAFKIDGDMQANMPAMIVQLDCILIPKVDWRRLAFKIDVDFQAMPLVKHSILGEISLKDMRGTCAHNH